MPMYLVGAAPGIKSDLDSTLANGRETRDMRFSQVLLRSPRMIRVSPLIGMHDKQMSLVVDYFQWLASCFGSSCSDGSPAKDILPCFEAWANAFPRSKHRQLKYSVANVTLFSQHICLREYRFGIPVGLVLPSGITSTFPLSQLEFLEP
ncbi:hypothetical protein Tco_0550878 [Tanacetum coccineum]